MPNTPEDEGLHERFLHADDEPKGEELAREVLDGAELAEYLRQKKSRK